MQVLYFFESIRNPFLNALFSAITYLGDELALIAIAIVVFWCVDKRTGYYVLISGFFGILLNQTLKLYAKVPRPWERDLKFTIVESAREAATGYSFPSGHSQNAVSVLGALFLTSNKKWVRIALASVAVLVPISRMYLGVHTLLDVLAGSAAAVMVLLILERAFSSDNAFHRAMPIIVLVLALGTAAFYIYAVVENRSSADVNTKEALKNARTILGCVLGLALVYPLDRFVIKFDTRAPWYAQLLKLAVGFAVVLAIKALLASILDSVFGDFGRVVRYFLMVSFAGAVWPITFKWFAKMKIPTLDRFGEKVKNVINMAAIKTK